MRAPHRGASQCATMITVITPTVRHEGLLLVAKALKRQTFKSWEWIIISPTEPKLDYPISYTWMQDPPKEPGDVWSLNKAYNAALKAAKGELIVSWQDWTYARGEALQKFWTHYQLDKKKIVSGVGNKYSDETFSVVTWQDPRKRDDQGSFYPCYFNDIEFNFCAIPAKAFLDVGGFDEKLDKHFGMDGFSVLDRLNIAGGWDFHLDQSNETFSLEHGRLPDWEEKNAIHGPYNERRKDYEQNPKLEYLR